MQEVSLDGCRIKVRRAGEGPPLLLLRGTDASDDWLPYMDRLATRYTVIVPEHPGFGGAQMPAWLDRVSDYASFYLDLVDHLKLDGVHLVGTSLGGWIAADLAHRCCQRLASLTLVAPSGLRLTGVDQVDTFLRTEEQALHDSFHDEKKAAAAAARMLAADTEDTRLQNAIAIARVAWNPRLFDPQLAKWLHRISVPTLIVWGEQDRMFPTPYAEAWRKAIPGARLEIVKACGHAVALEQPEALVDSIFDFTEKLRSAA